MTSVLIVGGGIAGISTGLALVEQDVTIDLVERNSGVRPAGSGITLVAPAIRALERLQVLSECVAEGYGTSQFKVYGVNGETLQVQSLPSAVGSGPPALLGMLRPTLHRILLDRATEKGLAVRTGLGAKAIDDHVDDVTVTFSDDSTADYDLVIGADGIRSCVRELVSGPIMPVFQQQVCYRVVVPRPQSVTGQGAFVGYGGINIGFTPTGEGSMYMYVLAPAEEPTPPPTNSLAEIVRGYLAPFGGVVTEIRESITDPEKVNFAALETVIPPEPWFKGNVVLVGDAVHCTTPHLGAGAAMCLEDALVLGAELGQGALNADALNRYSKRRFERCKYVVEASAQLGYWQTHPSISGADPEALRADALKVLAGPF